MPGLRFAALTCALLAVGCYQRPDARPCMTDEDCEAGQRCVNELCELGGGTGSSSSAGSTTTTSGGTATTTTTTGTSTTGSTGDASTGSTGMMTPPMVVFLNFDGVTVFEGGTDDSRSDTTELGPMLATTYAAYDDGDVMASMVMARVAQHFAPFNVTVTDTRPASGDYAMVIVTPTNPFMGGTLSVSSPDCGNTNANNIGFAFVSGLGLGTEIQANVVSGATAIGLGLERVQTMDAEVMAEIAVDSAQMFNDMCYPLRPMPAPVCTAQHDAQCGAGLAQQNSFAELMVLLGPA